MYIQNFRLENIRCFDSAEASFLPNLNIVTGVNTAGKTSFLEAIYFLATGRSFRSVFFDDIVKQGADYISTFAQLNFDEKLIPVGILREKNKTTVKIDGNYLNRLSKLAHYIPIQVYYPGNHEIFAGSAVNRRKLYDWFVFHVKPDFAELSIQLQHILKQRNKILKQTSDIKQLSYWNDIFVDLSTKLHILRSEFIQDISKIVNDYWCFFFQAKSK